MASTAQILQKLIFATFLNWETGLNQFIGIVLKFQTRVKYDIKIPGFWFVRHKPFKGFSWDTNAFVQLINENSMVDDIRNAQKDYYGVFPSFGLHKDVISGSI